MKKILCIIVCLLLPLPSVCASDAPKYIALTFDDGPSGRITNALLDGLAEREVHATFFICGYRTEQFPHVAKRIADEGHEIGVHGDQHTMFSQMSAAGVCADLAKAMQKIENASGQRPTLLRPPGGVYDLDVLKQTVCCDLPVILWSVDVEDWHRSNSSAIANDIAAQVKSGDIILLHDTKESSVNAALKLIDMLQERNFEFVTVSELAYLSCTKLAGSKAYYRFSFAKNASTCACDAETEPCAKVGFPPPRPFSSAFKLRTVSRRSPLRVPKA